MNIETVAVYSAEDKNSLHVQLATESVCIGPAAAKDSYLNIENILSAALLKGCEAVHPGYGFLAENSEFAKMTIKSGLEFIGPSDKIIADMGDKHTARQTMISSGVPVIPGSDDLLESLDKAKKVANNLSYPVILKASAGGGGKGMRRVYSDEEMEVEFFSAKKEALAAFGNDSVYMEKLIERAKHIEVQIIGDKYGNIIHLGERDCSVQRKNQKMMEEAPCRMLSSNLRKDILKAAINAARAVNYSSAGTIEFLVTEDNKFYFMEMNTRIQVEHPVTEMITGVDIVKEQIRVASGLSLSFTQEDVVIDGYAIECRINAENVRNAFMPSCGKVRLINMPGGNGVRIDSLIYDGYEISPFYDSMIAKLIVKGKTRHEALRKVRRCLEEFVIEGVFTNISLLYMLTYEIEFIKGSYRTDFVEKKLSSILKIGENLDQKLNIVNKS